MSNKDNNESYRTSMTSRYRDAYNTGKVGGNGDALSNDEVVSLLSAMLVEMQGTNIGINKFNDKEFKVINKPITIQDNSSRNVVNTKTESPKPATKHEDSFITQDVYSLAKRVAAGDVVWN